MPFSLSDRYLSSPKPKDLADTLFWSPLGNDSTLIWVVDHWTFENISTFHYSISWLFHVYNKFCEHLTNFRAKPEPDVKVFLVFSVLLPGAHVLLRPPNHQCYCLGRIFCVHRTTLNKPIRKFCFFWKCPNPTPWLVVSSTFRYLSKPPKPLHEETTCFYLQFCAFERFGLWVSFELVGHWRPKLL